MPHDQCPGNRRGHTWREPTAAALPEIPRRNLLALRICQRCGAIGRVNKQGVVVGTTIEQAKEAL